MTNFSATEQGTRTNLNSLRIIQHISLVNFRVALNIEGSKYMVCLSFCTVFFVY